MPEPPSASIAAAPLYEWRIIRLRGTPGTFVGYVNAPDQEQAIQKAAENFGIVEEDRWQLGAYETRRRGEDDSAWASGGGALRNIFDQYSQPENRVTHALLSALKEDRRLLSLFVREFGGAQAVGTGTAISRGGGPSEEELDRRGSTASSTSSIGGPRQPPSCCRGGDRHPQRCCS